jgi:hypothetical protein
MTDEKTQPTKSSIGKKVGLVILLAVIGVAIFIGINFSSMAKSQAEKVASKALGVKVQIGTLDIKLQEKKIVVNGLKIGNPKGYKNPHAVTIEQIVVDTKTISKELLVFDEIGATGTKVYLEVTEKGTNLSSLQKNIKANSNDKKKEASPVKVIIDRLYVENAKLSPLTTLTGKTPKDISLPKLTLRDVGRKSNGVLASEAIMQVLNPLIKSAMTQSVKAGMLEGLDSSVLKTMDLPSGVSSVLGKSGGDIEKNVKGQLDGLFSR